MNDYPYDDDDEEYPNWPECVPEDECSQDDGGYEGIPDSLEDAL